MKITVCDKYICRKDGISKDCCYFNTSRLVLITDLVVNDNLSCIFECCKYAIKIMRRVFAVNEKKLVEKKGGKFVICVVNTILRNNNTHLYAQFDKIR